jgi:hypothetical protein
MCWRVGGVRRLCVDETGLLPRDLDTDPPTMRGESDSYEWPLDRSFTINNGR